MKGRDFRCEVFETVITESDIEMKAGSKAWKIIRL